MSGTTHKERTGTTRSWSRGLSDFMNTATRSLLRTRTWSWSTMRSRFGCVRLRGLSANTRVVAFATTRTALLSPCRTVTSEVTIRTTTTLATRFRDGGRSTWSTRVSSTMLWGRVWTRTESGNGGFWPLRS